MSENPKKIRNPNAWPHGNSREIKNPMPTLANKGNGHSRQHHGLAHKRNLLSAPPLGSMPNLKLLQTVVAGTC